MRRALGSRAARLLFYSATRIYRPLPSLLDRCRKRQGTPLSFRTRSWGTHVCACVCGRGYSVHSVPEWLSCCSVMLHASTDLSPARGIAAVSVDALARLDWGRPRGWLPRRPSSRPTTASRTAATSCLSLSTSLTHSPAATPCGSPASPLARDIPLWQPKLACLRRSRTCRVVTGQRCRLWLTCTCRRPLASSRPSRPSIFAWLGWYTLALRSPL